MCESTSKKVQDAIAALRYEPSMLARGMNGDNRNVLGNYRPLRMDRDQVRAFLTLILEGSTSVIAETHYRVLLIPHLRLSRQVNTAASPLGISVVGRFREY